MDFIATIMWDVRMC